MKRLVFIALLAALVVPAFAAETVLWTEEQTGKVRGQWLFFSDTKNVTLTMDIQYADGSAFNWEYLPGSNWYGDEDEKFAHLFLSQNKEVYVDMAWSGMGMFMEANYILWDGQITGAATDGVVNAVLSSNPTRYSLLYDGTTLFVNGTAMDVDNFFFDAVGQVTGGEQITILMKRKWPLVRGWNLSLLRPSFPFPHPARSCWLVSAQASSAGSAVVVRCNRKSEPWVEFLQGRRRIVLRSACY
jgi:hypothetical protein